MPRKNNKTPEVRVLLRENQRRARARQKELIEDMRQRIRTYENQGIQASLDMQSAARAVAAENRCLRALLAQNGVAGETIDEFLRSNGLDKTTTIPTAIPTATLTATTTAIPTAIPTAASPTLSYDTQSTPTALPTPSTSTTSNSPASAGATPPCGTRRGSSPGTFMDCDVAASIVADLHGHGDPELARTTLGCTSGPCSVKATRVFSIIDNAT